MMGNLLVHIISQPLCLFVCLFIIFALSVFSKMHYSQSYKSFGQVLPFFSLISGTIPLLLQSLAGSVTKHLTTSWSPLANWNLFMNKSLQSLKQAFPQKGNNMCFWVADMVMCWLCVWYSTTSSITRILNISLEIW